MVFTQNIRYSCQILLNTKFLDRFFKITQMPNHKNPYSGSIGSPCGRTDKGTNRHDEASRRSLQFCERPYKPIPFCCSEFGQRGVGLLEGTIEVWKQSVSLIISF